MHSSSVESLGSAKPPEASKFVPRPEDIERVAGGAALFAARAGSEPIGCGAPQHQAAQLHMHGSNESGGEVIFRVEFPVPLRKVRGGVMRAPLQTLQAFAPAFRTRFKAT